MRYVVWAAFAAMVFGAVPALAQQPASNSCYAYRSKGSDSFQIACYPDAGACNANKADYTKKNPNIEALGCAPQIYCFTYNAEGKSAACYLDVNACAAERNKAAAKGGTVNGCVNNTRPGKPANTNYGPPALCFSYYEPGALTPSVVCARTAAACTQAMGDKRKYLVSKGAAGPDLTMAGNCMAPMYCVDTPKNNYSSVKCHPSGEACEKERAAAKGTAGLGACTVNDYQGTNLAKSR